jgi:hypothetical protein
MNIDIPDSLAVQDVAPDEPRNVVAIGSGRGRQILAQFKDRIAVAQTYARELTHDKRMHDDVRSFQQGDQPWIAAPEVIDPHGCVDPYQTALPWRLRGAAFNGGWVPPSRARRLTHSRSMRDFNPSLTMAVRSIGPVSFSAFASHSSSILLVVRMCSPYAKSFKFGITGCLFLC